MDIQKTYNISEFVAALEKQTTNICMFRGEKKDYGETKLVSAMLRSNENKSRFKMRCDYLYRRVFANISENEKEHFLAFAQHHGIPTNLLDATTNPLIALWFACENTDEDGVIYGFEDNYTFVDFTNFINMLGANYIHSNFHGDKIKLQDCFEESLCNSGINMKIEDALKSLFTSTMAQKENICKVLKTGFNDLLLPQGNGFYRKQYAPYNEFISNMAEYVNGLDFVYADDNENEISSCISAYIIDELPKILSDVEADDAHKENFVEYVKSRFFSRLLFIAYCEGGDIMSCLPRILYQPILSFKRAATQHSCFIYQWYDKKTHQTLHPEWEIHVDKSAKNKIRQDLCKFGLNKGTIFGDYDSIADDVIERTM